MKKPSKLSRKKTAAELMKDARPLADTHAVVARGQTLVSHRGGYPAVERLAQQFGFVERVLKAQRAAARGQLRERAVILGPDGRPVGDHEDAPRLIS